MTGTAEKEKTKVGFCGIGIMGLAMVSTCLLSCRPEQEPCSLLQRCRSSLLASAGQESAKSRV